MLILSYLPSCWAYQQSEGRWHHLNFANRGRKLQKEIVMTSTKTNQGRVEQVSHIQISNGVVFERWRWREAILTYLSGVWEKDADVINPPNLTLNYHWLRLDVGRQEYYAYTSPLTEEAEIPDPHG